MLCIDGLTDSYTFPGEGLGGAHRFHYDWQASGDMARNGPPLTPHALEMLDGGKEYTIQHFERVRLEYTRRTRPHTTYCSASSGGGSARSIRPSPH